MNPIHYPCQAFFWKPTEGNRTIGLPARGNQHFAIAGAIPKDFFSSSGFAWNAGMLWDHAGEPDET